MLRNRARFYRLRIGATKSIGDYILLPEIRRFLSAPGNRLTFLVDNTARLLDLQTWAAAESAAGRGPVLGNAGREVLRAEQGRMERADAGGTAVYTVRLQAEYTQVYTEENT